MKKEEPMHIFVVVPKYYIDDIDPLITQDRQQAEERMLEFDSEDDFTFHDGLHDMDVADNIVRYFWQEKRQRDNKPVHFVLLPSFSCTRGPFITVHPREVELYKETVDESATVKEGKTLLEARKIVQEYKKTKENVLCHGVYKTVAKNVAEKRQEDCGDVIVIDSDESVASSSADTVSIQEEETDKTELFPGYKLPGAPSGSDLLTTHPKYDPKKVKVEPGESTILVLPDFDNERPALVTHDPKAAEKYCSEDPLAIVRNGMSIESANAEKETYDSDKLKHMHRIGWQMARDVTATKTTNHVPSNPYITPKKNTISMTPHASDMSAAIKQQRRVSFGQASSVQPTNLNYALSGMPTEHLPDEQASLKTSENVRKAAQDALNWLKENVKEEKQPALAKGANLQNPYATPTKQIKMEDSTTKFSPPDPPQPAEKQAAYASYHPSFVPLPDAAQSNSNATRSLPGILAKSSAGNVSVTEKKMGTESLTGSRLSSSELIARRQERNKQNMRKNTYMMKVAHFMPVLGAQEFVPVSVQWLRLSDRTPHWQLKWRIVSTLLSEFRPKFATSHLWFGTVTALPIRNIPGGKNVEKVNRSDFTEYQGVGMVSLTELEKGESLSDVCQNLAHDLKIVMSSPEFIEMYLQALMKEQLQGLEKYIRKEMSDASKHKDRTVLADQLKDAQIKIESKPSLDALLLDNDILEIAQMIYGTETEEKPWPNDVKRACYKSGKLPNDFD